MDFNDWITERAYQDSPFVVVDKLPKQVIAVTKPCITKSSVGVYVSIGEVNKRDELIRDLWSGFECGVAKCCNQCPSSAKLSESECAIERRIEELGIEVTP